ncbi:Mediator of RNA polymerase II transcription subunit 10 [Wickerhamomyces ciferrii]|uniref:Mediator of RNA polymerase II transcription subunit 10 n=1 Tax=Wickerhamomyces ciferrii (strain ATCC 14091 / BCRC 22168 / CBS 111 / JCM 3599 / NBRC 0793 / NRRL Y-1031 F-60-10) TaxID=1206466 RepID=K0KLM7_WICCF|nr:Mediator of RNA polymerase II transcription subunit 10 [Wickerhamomyces ciferrii]CCH42249.1 Mediator of RNA polymerase II transcription subunit 10 [Wickerhamomyces ciferrii]
MSTDTEQAINQTRDTLASLIESFIELGVIVHDFQGTESSKDALAIRLNETIETLGKLQKPESSALDQVPIPRDVLEYIEDGRNPDVYTREFVEATRKSNQYLRGKMAAMKDLREILGKKISSEFPELSEVVEDIKKRTN